MISDSVSKRILTWFLRTDRNIRYRPFVIGQIILPGLCNSNHPGCLGILEVIYVSGIIVVLGIRNYIICTTCFREFYRGGVLPELILLADTGTAIIAAIVAPIIILGTNLFNFITHIPPEIHLEII